MLNICGIFFKFCKLFLFDIYFMLMPQSYNILYYQMSISGRDHFTYY
jgi:hypothetical protein